LAAVFTLAGCLLGLNVHPANRILCHGALSLPETKIRRRYRPGRDQVDRTGCGELAPTQASSATGKITSRRHAAGVLWWQLVGGWQGKSRKRYAASSEGPADHHGAQPLHGPDSPETDSQSR
jgi:hypothetical protein